MFNKLPIITIIGLIFISCAARKQLSGTYKTDYENGMSYVLNLKNNTYVWSTSNNGDHTGKFKVVTLSSTKKLIIFEDLIMSHTSNYIREIQENGDSIFIDHSNFGSTVFEIDLQDKNNIKYRKTYSNELEKTKHRGKLFLIN